METLDSIIATHPFFKGLDERYLQLIAGCGTNVMFDAGSYLFREGEDADRFYAVRHGRVAIEIYVPQRGPVVLETVREGEMLGWSWLFPPYRRQFDARAMEVVRATSFDGACLRAKCEQDPAMGYEIMKRLAGLFSRRLQAARLQLLDMYGPSRNE